MHLLRRGLQVAGLPLNRRARVLPAPFRQGPNGPELLGIRTLEQDRQPAREVGQELRGIPTMPHVLQDRVAGVAHGVVQTLRDDP
jgi:hypothetical protein